MCVNRLEYTEVTINRKTFTWKIDLSTTGKLAVNSFSSFCRSKRTLTRYYTVL